MTFELSDAATCSEVIALRKSPKLTWAIATAASASRSRFGLGYLRDGETKASLSNRGEPEFRQR